MPTFSTLDAGHLVETAGNDLVKLGAVDLSVPSMRVIWLKPGKGGSGSTADLPFSTLDAGHLVETQADNPIKWLKYVLSVPSMRVIWLKQSWWKTAK